jgi:drug/metabolite transporter (DMT)-like permease
MLAAGIAWGIYSLRGKRSGDPTIATAGNFMRAVPFAVILSLVMPGGAKADTAGVLLAVASGALASGLGYAIWYTALPGLTATKAATIQLSVPVIAAVAAVVLLGEAITLRLVLGSAAILGGIALVVVTKRPA